MFTRVNAGCSHHLRPPGRPLSHSLSAQASFFRVSVGPENAEQVIHIIAVQASSATILSHVHFFSGATGPDLPTYVVRIGSRPGCVSEGRSRAHYARYFDEQAHWSSQGSVDTLLPALVSGFELIRAIATEVAVPA